MIRKILFTFFFPCLVFSLEEQPWFGEIFQLQFLTGYSYSHYRSVEGASPPLQSPSNDHLLFFGLDVPFSPQGIVDFDLQFADTPRQSFGFRSTAFQGRYLWLDDVVGDALSLATGGSIRITSSDSLRDVSCPYHSHVDFEANIGIGKEWDQLQFYRFRLWGFGVIGQGTKGSPWVRGTLSFEGNHHNKYRWALFSHLSQGFGRKTSIDIDHFDGYGRIRQKSIDVGGRFSVSLSVYGALRFAYTRRVLAKRCPKNVNTFTIDYRVPFSF